MEFFEHGLDCLLVLMEGEDGWHATSPVELKYLTWSSERKLLCQTMPSELGPISMD